MIGFVASDSKHVPQHYVKRLLFSSPLTISSTVPCTVPAWGLYNGDYTLTRSPKRKRVLRGRITKPIGTSYKTGDTWNHWGKWTNTGFNTPSNWELRLEAE